MLASESEEWLTCPATRKGRIGDHETCWTNIARPQIEGRILQYEESQIAFNLLALCPRPVTLHRRSIIEAAAAIALLKEHMKHDSKFTNLVNKQPPVLDVANAADLAEFNLRPSDFQNAKLGETLQTRISRAASDSDEAWGLYEQFVVDLKVAIGEYRAEIYSLAVDEQRVKDRKKDHGQALHRWVQKLAEKGVLQELIENS